MSPTPETPESPVGAPERSRKAGTPQNRHKGFTPLRKALAACVVGAFLLTGAGFASHGFTANPVDAFASQTHDAQASNGLLPDHDSGAKGGLTDDAAKAVAVAVAKTSLVDVPVGVQHSASEQYGTVSIPRLGADWTHYLVEGKFQGQLDLPGTDDPNAVGNYKTAVAHNTGTQNLGEIGNVGLEAHRTPNTFLHLDSLQIGDTISIKEAKSGNVYTYAVTKTMRDNPAIQYDPKTREPGLPFITKDDQDYASSVVDPIPFDDNSWSAPGHPAKNPATKRLLTLTSCGVNPDTTNDWRIYVIAELQSVTAEKAGK